MNNKQCKAIQMPSSDEIIARLQAMNKHNDDYDMHLYRCIANRLVGAKNGSGVVMVIDLAINDYMRAGDYPPAMQALLILSIPMYIDALIDDDEVKCDALDFCRLLTKVD